MFVKHRIQGYNPHVTLPLHNKKARFNYELKDTFSVGVELTGAEAKALRFRGGTLEGAHAQIRGGELFLINAFIPPYQEGNTSASYNPRRTRKLLAKKKEIKELLSATEQGLTLIPISLYNKTRFIKCDIALARGKKKYDKRETLKRRDAERDMRRSLKTE